MNIEQGVVTFGTQNIDFTVIRSNRRHTVSIFVDPLNGVYLRAPVSSTFEKLKKIIRKKSAWISDKKNRIKEISDSFLNKEFVSGESFLYLGRKYQLRIVKLRKKTNNKICVKSKYILINPSVNFNDSEKTRNLLCHWYRKHAKMVLAKRVKILSKKFNVNVTKIFLTNPTKRWGSCNSKGELRFNWRIISAPLSLIDYVVAHELCHLRCNNHSKNFWKLLGSIIPDYELRRERLRKEGIIYLHNV